MKTKPDLEDKEPKNTAETVEVITSKPKENHRLHWEGPYAVCSSCDYPHTIPVDPKKYSIVNGLLVKNIPE